MSNKSAFVDNITPYLKTVQGRTMQMNIVMRKISLDMKREIRKRFSESKDLNGKSWSPLKKIRKKRGGARAKPLVNTGRLMRSITPKSSLLSAQVGTNVSYAEVHDQGYVNRVDKVSSKGKRFVAGMNIPKRQFSGLSKHQKIRYNTWLRRFILYGR